MMVSIWRGSSSKLICHRGFFCPQICSREQQCARGLSFSEKCQGLSLALGVISDCQVLIHFEVDTRLIDVIIP
jgi:hypothetical protein